MLKATAWALAIFSLIVLLGTVPTPDDFRQRIIRPFLAHASKQVQKQEGGAEKTFRAVLPVIAQKIETRQLEELESDLVKSLVVQHWLVAGTFQVRHGECQSHYLGIAQTFIMLSDGCGFEPYLAQERK